MFITAVFKAEEFFQRGYAVGAIDYLTKPIDDNLLLNRIRLYRNLHRREQELSATIERLQRREHALSEARAAAETANRAKSLFLANMSHELRTPLNAILGFAQIMARDPLIPDYERRNLETINQSGRHLLALINDVLEISRIEAGRTQIEREPFDLAATLRAVEEMIRLRASGKGLALKVEHQGELPRWVTGDAHHLRQVLLNLLGNAVKYTDQGGITLRITPAGERIRFEVEDTGPGIAPADQEHIFEAFYQAETGIAKGEGAGLGLSISCQYVRLMGGELGLRSEPGQGSTFAFTIPLPAATAGRETGLSPASTGLIEALAPDQPETRILIAEDQPESQRMIQHLLEQVGFITRLACNGEEAVELFQGWSPHLVLMDMRMPVLDGYEATRRIRALPGGAGIPVLALTASAFAEEREAILAAGCTDVASKPIDADVLLERIGDLLGLEYRRAEPASLAPSPIRTDFSALPETARAELIDASIRLDIQHTRAIAERLRPEHPAEAGVIEGLLDDYQFERILALCRGEAG